MLNHGILPPRCPPVTYPSLRPCLAWNPSPHRPNRSLATWTTRERVSWSEHHRKRKPFLRARFEYAQTSNKLKQEQRQSSFAKQVSRLARRLGRLRPVKSGCWRLFPPKTISGACAPLGDQRQKRQGRVSPRPVISGWGRLLHINPLRRMGQIQGPLRLEGRPLREIRRTHYVSVSLWPKDTCWNSRQPTTDTRWNTQQSATDLLDKFDWNWTKNFQTMKLPEEMQRWTSLGTKQVIRYYWGLRSARNRSNEEWMGLQGYDASRLWRNVMLWCLLKQKKQGLMLLLATFKGNKYRPPRFVVSNCLRFLARHFLFRVSNPNPMAIDAIWLLTRKLIDGASDQKQNFAISQNLVYIVLQHSDDLRVLSLYDLLGVNKTLLHVNTMLHFFDRFLDMGRINLSMRLLGAIAGTKFNLCSDRIQMACVKLLRARFDTPEEYTVRRNILTQILELRIKPNVPMLNTILLNAGEGGDFANAWQMYGLAQENGFKANSITYGVLLKGALLSGEFSNLEMVIREIHVNGKVLEDLRLVSDVLDGINLVSPGDQFGAMLDFYKQHCDLRPLQELSLCGDETPAPPGANGRRVWPTKYILTQMIIAYVRLHHYSNGLVHCYNLYHHHVKNNHPLIAPLAQEDFVANAFVMAFGKSPYTLQYSTTVVKHMLEFSSSSSAALNSIPFRAPTARTWSILAAAHFRHGQQGAAGKVLDMMRERSLQYDKPTWNTLISGYAGLQNISAAVDTMKRMKVAGFEADAYTHEALGRLRAHGLLRKALEISREEEMAKPKTTRGFAPSLTSHEQYEANIAMEWGLTSVEREEEVLGYLKTKDPEWLH